MSDKEKEFIEICNAIWELKELESTMPEPIGWYIVGTKEQLAFIEALINDSPSDPDGFTRVEIDPL